MKSLPKQTQAMDCLIPMGVTSENVSKKFGLKRETLDAFAAYSHHKASAAANAGKFRNEIVPVTIQTSEGTSIRINKDDGIRPQTTVEILGKLKPVFSKKGSTTAGNSSQTTDGAAAILCMTRQEAESRGLHILAVWKGFAVAGVPPAFMGMGPAVAIPKLLKKQRVSTNEVDVWEINEAFASQASWCISELGISPAKVNPNGGAIALGHALGCTGARMIATLVHEMDRTHEKYGVVSMCIGTGMGAAALLENPNSSIRSNL
jgi:acetyl-CoA acetyltransferase family protein